MTYIDQVLPELSQEQKDNLQALTEQAYADERETIASVDKEFSLYEQAQDRSEASRAAVHTVLRILFSDRPFFDSRMMTTLLIKNARFAGSLKVYQ